MHMHGYPLFSPSYITRFSQPDTIVPNVTNPQSLNRYSYTLNNPIRYNDPTGHCFADGHWVSGIGGNGACTSSSRRPVVVVQDAPQGHTGIQDRLDLFDDFREYLGKDYTFVDAEGRFMDWIYDSGRFESPFWNEGNGYLLMSMMAGMEAHQIGGYSLDPGVQEWINFLNNPTAANFWIAHNAALREGAARAGASGAFDREPQYEQALINKALTNVYNLGDECGAGSKVSCGLANEFLIRMSTVTYPHEYPADEVGVVLTMDYSGNTSLLADLFGIVASGYEACLVLNSPDNYSNCMPARP